MLFGNIRVVYCILVVFFGSFVFAGCKSAAQVHPLLEGIAPFWAPEIADSVDGWAPTEPWDDLAVTEVPFSKLYSSGARKIHSRPVLLIKVTVAILLNLTTFLNAPIGDQTGIWDPRPIQQARRVAEIDWNPPQPPCSSGD